MPPLELRSLVVRSTRIALDLRSAYRRYLPAHSAADQLCAPFWSGTGSDALKNLFGNGSREPGPGQHSTQRRGPCSIALLLLFASGKVRAQQRIYNWGDSNDCVTSSGG